MAADSVHPGPVLLQEIVGREELGRTHRPRHDADVFVTPGEEVETPEPNLTASDSPRRLLQQVHDRKGRDGLPGARFSDEAEHFALPNLQIDIVHRS